MLPEFVALLIVMKDLLYKKGEAMVGQVLNARYISSDMRLDACK